MKSWNPRAVLAGMLLVVLSTGVRVGAGAAPTWPEPPRQRSPWTPPATSLPPALLAATATLFEQGLADPRGCEYRAIEVMAGSSTNGSAQPLRTHGWVLPATGAGPRFAVCWDGLVYPALSVGAAADLRADVTTGVERIDREKKGGLGTGYRHWSMGAANGLASDSANPLQMCLLLRLGEERLAQRVWSVWQPQASDQGPYLELASDWLWYLFDRTVSAHARGDDALALAGARLLAPARDAVEAEAARQGLKRPVRYVGRVAEPAPYVDFGTDPQELLRDQERRSRPAAPDSRIAARIRALEEVAERQRMQPGSPFLSNSPLVRALIREGDRAVSPLIDCLEHDSRLTRSVHYSRNFQRHREVLPVRSAAYAALSGILKTSSFGPEPRAGRSWAKTAAQVRAYWQQNQGRTQAERWYRTLRDDQAGPEGWLEAAGHLTFPVFPKSEPEVTSPQHPAFGTIGSRRTPPLQGEALRNRTEPSVSAVLEQRVTELSAGPPDSTRIAAAVELALYLSTWDPKAAVPTLRRLFHRCEQFYPSGKPDAPAGFDPEFVATRLSRLTLARVRGKDADALPDYTHWMLAAEPKTDGRGIFEPLWTYPNDPAVRTAASILFNAPGSRWREEVEKQAGSSVVSQDFVHSPLLGVTAFRVLLYRLLADRSPAGTARLDRKGGLGITTPVSSIGSSGGQYLDDPRGARPETTVRFRKCDFVAATLSQIGGAPEFELFWREEARDAALPRVVQFLRRYGPRLAYADVQIH
ncbi:MAG: hypothetical protein K0Q72_3547, partial [Armatimonadetes bacterium]|nr:hypothetical protein [Armatimonadota bacterium]